MSFKEICEKLGIPEYTEEIFSAGYRGDLFHCYAYLELLKFNKETINRFREFFLELIDVSEDKDKRAMLIRMAPELYISEKARQNLFNNEQEKTTQDSPSER